MKLPPCWSLHVEAQGNTNDDTTLDVGGLACRASWKAVLCSHPNSIECLSRGVPDEPEEIDAEDGEHGEDEEEEQHDVGELRDRARERLKHRLRCAEPSVSSQIASLCCESESAVRKPA
eukprot:926729-Rhodomonas_salina.3